MFTNNKQLEQLSDVNTKGCMSNRILGWSKVKSLSVSTLYRLQIC